MAEDIEKVETPEEPVKGEAGKTTPEDDGTWKTVGGEEAAEAQEKPSDEDQSKAFFQAKYQEQKKEFDSVLSFLEDNGIDRPTLDNWMGGTSPKETPAAEPDTYPEEEAPLTEARLVQLLNQRDQQQRRDT